MISASTDPVMMGSSVAGCGISSGHVQASPQVRPLSFSRLSRFDTLEDVFLFGVADGALPRPDGEFVRLAWA